MRKEKLIPFRLLVQKNGEWVDLKTLPHDERERIKRKLNQQGLEALGYRRVEGE